MKIVVIKMRTDFIKLLKKLYLKKELLPDMLIMAMVIMLLSLFPKMYEKISGNRSLYGIAVIILTVVAVVILCKRLAKRNKSGDRFNVVRFILTILSVIFVCILLSSVTSMFSIVDLHTESDIYSIKQKSSSFGGAFINGVAFVFISQVFFSSIRNAYDNTKMYIEKMIKSLLFAGSPLLVLTFFILFISRLHLVVGIFCTFFIWTTAYVFNDGYEEIAEFFNKYMRFGKQ